jgi:hypothetical protein
MNEQGSDLAVQPDQERRSMNQPHRSTRCSDESHIYEIRLQGHLDQCWADWFDSLAITLEESGETVLTGPVIDQAALHGLLKKVRDLGLPLRSVNCLEPGRTNLQESHYDGA